MKILIAVAAGFLGLACAGHADSSDNRAPYRTVIVGEEETHDGRVVLGGRLFQLAPVSPNDVLSVEHGTLDLNAIDWLEAIIDADDELRGAGLLLQNTDFEGAVRVWAPDRRSEFLPDDTLPAVLADSDYDVLWHARLGPVPSRGTLILLPKDDDARLFVFCPFDRNEWPHWMICSVRSWYRDDPAFEVQLTVFVPEGGPLPKFIEMNERAHALIRCLDVTRDNDAEHFRPETEDLAPGGRCRIRQFLD